MKSENDAVQAVLIAEEALRRLKERDNPNGGAQFRRHYDPLKCRAEAALEKARARLAKIQSTSGRAAVPHRPKVSGDKLNRKRAENGAITLIRYAALHRPIKGAARSLPPDPPLGSQDDLVALLTDLRHLAHRDPEMDFKNADDIAQSNFDEHLAAEAEQKNLTLAQQKHNKRHIIKSSRPFSIT